MPIDNNLDGSFVKEIASLVHPEPKVVPAPRGEYIVLAGDQETHYGTPLLAEPKTLRVATLGAIVDAVQQNLFDSSAVVHVASPTNVYLLDPSVGDERQQFVFLSAQASTQEPRYQSFTALDEFIIGILTNTSETPDRTRLLDYVGSLTAGLATEISDSGAAQETVSKRGITRVGAPTKWENPVQLAPFRTFAEIEQPVSAFVLRLRTQKMGEEITAQAALFEADGGAWRLSAISAIGAWLRERLPEGTVVLS